MQCKMKYFWHVQQDSDNYVVSDKHQGYELVYYKFGCGVSQIGSEKQDYSDNSIAFFNLVQCMIKRTGTTAKLSALDLS